MGVRVRDLRTATKSLTVKVTENVTVDIKYRPLAITPESSDEHFALLEEKKYTEALFGWVEETIAWWELVDVVPIRNEAGEIQYDAEGKPLPERDLDGGEIEEMVPIKADCIKGTVPREVLTSIFDAVNQEMYPNLKSSETSAAG